MDDNPLRNPVHLRFGYFSFIGPPTYLFRADRDSHGGGILVCGKVIDLFTYRKTLVLTSSLEVLTINISALNTTSLSVTVIYRRPACHSTHVIQSLSQILCHVSHPSPHIVLGDINEDLLSPSTNKRTCTTIDDSSWFYTDFTRPHYNLRFIIGPHLHQKSSSPNPLLHLRHLLF